MNISVLEYIVNHKIELIQENAVESKSDPLATVGVAKYLLGNKGDVSNLSSAQNYHYEKFILPLIKNVACEGVLGDGTCKSDGFIDDESLVGCYIEDEFLCQHCRFDLARISAE
jgi:hypothetical protein